MSPSTMPRLIILLLFLTGAVAQSVAPQTVTLTDPQGDDNGPGTYTYPTGLAYRPGTFDLLKLGITKDKKVVDFSVSTRSQPEDPWAMGVKHFLPTIFIFIDTDGKPGSGFTGGIPGLNIQFAPKDAWDKLVIISSQSSKIRTEIEKKAPHLLRALVFPSRTSSADSTLLASVAAGSLGRGNPSDWRYQVIVPSATELFSTGTDLIATNVSQYEGQNHFGGGSDSSCDPNVIDILAESASGNEGEIDAQHKMLSYECRSDGSPTRLATLSLVPGRRVFESTRPEDQDPLGAEKSQAAWNVFAESRSRLAKKFVPLSVLNKESSYEFTIDLAFWPYDVAGVSSSFGSAQLREQLELASPDDPPILQIIPLPDPSGALIFDDNYSELEIKPESLGQLSQQASMRPPKDILKYLQKNPNPDWVLGRAHIKFRTTSVTTLAAPTFSVWYKGRPIDEIAHVVCVAEGGDIRKLCNERLPIRSVGVSGLDSMRLGQTSEVPDLAMHILSVGSDLFALLNCNTCDRKIGGPLAWSLNRNPESLEEYLDQTFRKPLDDALAAGPETRDALLRSVGLGAKGVLFPAEQKDIDVERALKLFEELSQEPKGPKPSLFARIAPLPHNSSIGPMLSFAWIPIPGNVESYMANGYRLEMPLPRQSYDDGSACIDVLKLFFPASVSIDKPVSDGLDEILPALEQLSFSSQLEVEEDWDAMQKWLQDDKAPEATVALFLLVHQRDNSLLPRIDKPAVPLFASSLGRKYGKRAVGILAACGSGGPASSEFAWKLNSLGMDSLVVSAMNLSPKIGGEYIRALLESIESSNEPVPIGALHSKILDGLVKVYGPQVYGLSLLGDGSIRFCGRTKMSG